MDQVIVGVMSGSSLDGIDVVACHFDSFASKESFHIDSYSLIKADTLPIPEELTKLLRSSSDASATELLALDSQYGKYLGAILSDWVQKNNLKATLIGCHGHTVFHFPERGISFQLGKGAEMALLTGVPVVTDFRSADIAAGGQGAPMIAIAEQWLFPNYDLFINLGGICNATVRSDTHFTSLDICVCNQLLNYLANKLGFLYDDRGRLAETGRVDDSLLQALLVDEWYQKPPPKSLDNSFFLQRVKPIVDQSPIDLHDKLATAVRYISYCIFQSITAIHPGPFQSDKVLITGGGAFNETLVKSIADQFGMTLSLPADELIHYKEAIMVALCGWLCLAQRPNFIPSATGADFASVGGAIHFPPESIRIHR